MFGMLVTIYLFLGGAGAALVAVLASCDLAAGWHRSAPSLDRGWARQVTSSFLGRGFAVAFIVLALGAFCLLLDLERPERFPLVLAYPTPTLLSFGSYVLSGTLVLAAALCLLHLMAPGKLPRPIMVALDIAAAVLGAATVTYTGLFFSGIDFVALWDNVGLPFLFVASSTSVGLAVALGLALMGSEGRITALSRALSRADMIAVVFEIAALAVYVGAAVMQGRASELVAVVVGPACSLVFVGIIGLGLLAPLAIEVVSFRMRSAAVAALVVPCVVIGGFALRYAVVMMPLM